MPGSAVAGPAKGRAGSKKPRGRDSVSNGQVRQRSSSQRPRADETSAVGASPTAAAAVPAPLLSSSPTAHAPNAKATNAKPTKSDTQEKKRGTGASSKAEKTPETARSGGQRSKARPLAPPSQPHRESGRRTSSPHFAATDPPRYRNSLSSSNATDPHHIFPSSYSSQVHPPGAGRVGSSSSGGGRRRSTTSRLARNVAATVAVVRLQRATRLFLMRRALRRIPVAAVAPRNSMDELSYLSHGGFEGSSNLIDVLVVPSSPPATESRMVHRIRAALDRAERLESLRAMRAKRTIVDALRAWVRGWRLAHRRVGTFPSSSPPLFDADDVDAGAPVPGSLRHRMEVDGEAEMALCIVQAVLRAQHSRRCVADLRLQHWRSRAAVRIQRAWRGSPLHRAQLRHLYDCHAQEVLARHEALERRDLLRRHLTFLVRCHQQLYNAPCMWEAGVAIRRLPLYSAEGLFLSEHASACVAGPLQLLAASANSPGKLDDNEEETSSAARLSPPATVPAALRFTSSSYSTAATAEDEYEGRRGSSSGAANTKETTSGGKGVQASGTAWWSNDAQLDVDAELRHCQYRLFFSPEDRRLLEEQEEKNASASVQSRSAKRSDVQPSSMCALTPEAEGKSTSTSPSPPPSPDLAESVSYATAFASALTFLRQPPAVDPALQHALQHMEFTRSDPVQLLRALHTHGHLAAELIAPFTCYALHYQSVARGEEDQAVLASTAAMQMCQPVVAGVAGNAALELRNCLVGAVPRAMTEHGSVGLPLPLLEHKCRREAAARLYASSGEATKEEESRRGREGQRTPLRWPAAATLQRSGFASPATQALFCRREGGGESAAAAAAGTATAAAHVPTDTAARRGQAEGNSSGDTEAAVAPWDHRLAAGEGEVGAAWRQFLLSIPASPVSDPTSTLKKAPPERGRAATVSTPELDGGTPRLVLPAPTPPPPPSTSRHFVGLSSHLSPASARAAPSLSLLLSDFASFATQSSTQKPGGNEWRASGVYSKVSVTAQGNNEAGSLVVDVSGSRHAIDAPTTVVRVEEWWDAVERLLLQERFRRQSVEHNESEQRRSVGVLRRLATQSSTLFITKAVATTTRASAS